MVLFVKNENFVKDAKGRKWLYPEKFMPTFKLTNMCQILDTHNDRKPLKHGLLVGCVFMRWHIKPKRKDLCEFLESCVFM
jgi:hypothetical protein